MNKKDIIKWIKEHKKELIIAGISITAIVAFVLGIKNKDILKETMKNLQEVIKKGYKYSNKWFEKVTDTELDVEREKVRLAFCESSDDFTASSLQKLLLRFDKEISKRAWGDEVPHGPSIHREHGWYLSNDD